MNQESHRRKRIGQVGLPQLDTKCRRESSAVPPLPTGTTRVPSGQRRWRVLAGGRGTHPLRLDIERGWGMLGDPTAFLQVGPQVASRTGAGRCGKLRLNVGDKGRNIGVGRIGVRGDEVEEGEN